MISTAAGPCTRIERRSPARHTYRTRLASSAEDVRAAQLLRFLVFNVELREGLENSYDTCLDADRFDDACDHLLVEEMTTGEVVGTYRLQTGTRAAAGHGYYSAQEFDFVPYEPLRPRILELGRACILASHRNFTVLSQLWKGIGAYAQMHGARYFIGCSSINSQDPAVGAAAFEVLRTKLAASRWQTRPLAGFECPLTGATTVTPHIPKLLMAYLSLGAKICGPPALDREFKTLDFLTLLEFDALQPRVLDRWLR